MSFLPTESRLPSPSSSLSSLLAALSTALLVGFAVAMVLELLPVRLLEPAWQWRLCSFLIDNAAVAAVGLGLLHLAAYVDSDNQSCQKRLRNLRPWAAAAALGFLLLIPLQGLSVARGLRNATISQNSQARQVNRNLFQLRQAIESAPDLASLQQRIPASLANSVGPLVFQQPLPAIKAQLLTLVDQAQKRASAPIKPPTQEALWPLVQRSLRVLLAAPVYAMAFAAMSVDPETNLSLLDRWASAWRDRRRRDNGRVSASQEAEYIRQLSGEEDG